MAQWTTMWFLLVAKQVIAQEGMVTQEVARAVPQQSDEIQDVRQVLAHGVGQQEVSQQRTRRMVAEPSWTPDEVDTVITAVATRFASSTIILTHNENNDPSVSWQHFLVSTRKMIISRGMYSLCIPMSSLGMYRRTHDPISPAVYVFFSHYRTSAQILTEVSNGVGLSRSKFSTSMWKTGNPYYILFISEHTAPAQFLANVFIPFESNFFLAQKSHDNGTTIVLHEVFRLAKGRDLHLQQFGSIHFHQSHHVQLNPLSWYQRHKDITGYVVNAATKHSPPYSIIKTDGDHYEASGFVHQVWRILEEDLNFITTLEVYASDTPDLDLDRIMSFVKFEVLLLTFPVMGHSYDLVKILTPLTRTSYQMFLRQPQLSHLGWESLQMPFERRLWWLALGVTVISGVILTLMQMVAHSLEHPETYSISDCWLTVAAATVLQGVDATPRSCALRVAFLSTYMTSLLIFTGYSAKLIAYLTQLRVVPSYQDMHQFMEDGSLNLTFLDMSLAAKTLFTANGEMMDAVKAYWLERNPNLHGVSTIDALLDCMCNKHYAIFELTQVVSMAKCPHITVPHMQVPTVLSIISSRNFEVARIINHRMNRLRDAGIFSRLLQSLSPLVTIQPQEMLQSVQFESIRPICLLLLMGIGVTVIILLLEYVTWKITVVCCTSTTIVRSNNN